MEDNELRELFLEMFGESDPQLQSAFPQEPTRPPRPHTPARQPQPAQSTTPDPPAQTSPRFFIKKIRGTANYVENHTNDFYDEMARLNPTFQVVSTTAVELPDSVCLFITYRL